MVDKKILIIADDPNVRNLLAQAFAKGRFRSFAVPDGGSAVLQFGLIQPDLVILDVPTGDRDRWKTLRRIRELSSVPLLALIEEEDWEGGSESLERGADIFLVRPFDLRELEARVRALLRRVQYTARSLRQSQTEPIFGRYPC